MHRIGKKEVFAYAVSTTNTCGRFPQDPPGPGRPARAGHLRRRALPRGGAQVVISRAFGTGEHIFYRGVTDGSGILSGIRLPAPPFAWSQASDTAALSGLDYQVSVQHPMFQPVAGRTATVFDGVETILPVMLEPVV